jgi:hypothetical protein
MNGKISEKQISTHLREVEDEEELIQLRIASLNKELEQKKKVKDKLRTKANKMKTRVPMVSEHGLLRYLERVQGMDTEALKKEILHPNVLAPVEKLGPSGTYPHPDGYSLIFKNMTVVSVIK